MGSLKDELFDKMDEKRDRIVADELGITYEEYQEIDGDIDNEPDDDGNPRHLFVHFNADARKEILEKIRKKYRIENGRTVDLDPWLFANRASDREAKQEY